MSGDSIIPSSSHGRPPAQTNGWAKGYTIFSLSNATGIKELACNTCQWVYNFITSS